MTRLLAVLALTSALAAWQTADSLVNSMTTMSKPLGLRGRVTLTRSVPGVAPVVRQLEVTRLHDRTRRTTLYRQVWPEVPGGLALVLDDAGDHRLKGFWYRAGTVTPLTSRMIGDAFFDSDATLEDAAEQFWFWPARRVAGRESVGEYDCTVVELRPPPRAGSQYSLIKGWVSPELSAALRIEHYGANGQLVKRTGMFRMTRIQDRWVPGIITVEAAATRNRTVLEATQLDHDARVSAADFTVAAIRRAGRGTGRVARPPR